MLINVCVYIYMYTHTHTNIYTYVCTEKVWKSLQEFPLIERLRDILTFS